MKNKLTTLVLAILTVSFTYAIESTPDSMYIHFTGSNGDSIAVHAIADVDSIVYYAPAVAEEQDIDWDNVAEGVLQANALTDADGNSYSAVKIGTQIWMSSNLAVSATTITDAIDGDTATAICGNSDAYVWSNTVVSYGKLYSYEAANKACPSGWHLPSNAEWTSLTNYLSSSHTGSEGTALKSTTGWNSNGNGTDNYGFTALPGGTCLKNGAHRYQGSRGQWWNNTQSGSSGAYNISLYDDGAYVGSSSTYRYSGFSVRCLRD